MNQQTKPDAAPVESVVRLRPRHVEELNQVLVSKRPEWALGVLAACELLEQEGAVNSNGYSLGDAVLAKLNLLSRQCRVRIGLR